MIHQKLQKLLDEYSKTNDSRKIHALVESLVQIQTLPPQQFEAIAENEPAQQDSASLVKPTTFRLSLEESHDSQENVEDKTLLVQTPDRTMVAQRNIPSPPGSDDAESDSLTLCHAEALDENPAFARKFPLIDPKRYSQLTMLGRGGMGSVWRVQDEYLHRILAMKIIHEQLAFSPEERNNFIDEAQINAQLQHPGIVPIHDIGELPNGNLYFTMKEVKGRTLKEIMKEVHTISTGGQWKSTKDGWSFRRLIDVFHSICETIAYAHSRGVIHRDIKPSNIMVGDYGEVLVLDWGIALVLQKSLHKPFDPETSLVETDRSQQTDNPLETMKIIGTPIYMSPEQASGGADRLDARSDIYSLGAVLYQILSGQNAYSGSEWTIIVNKCSKAPAPLIPNEASDALPPKEDVEKKRPIPRVLVEACEKAMQRSPDERYQSAAELTTVIREWLEGVQRREKAQSVLQQAKELQRQILQVQHNAQYLWEQANEEIYKQGIRSVNAWSMWEESQTLKEQTRTMTQEVQQLLQGALIHDPEMVETYEHLTELECRDYIECMMRNDRLGAQKSKRKLRTYLEMLPSNQQNRWKSQLNLQLSSLQARPQQQGVSIGRSQQKREISDLLSRYQLVTITGTAGVGKTHLALEVAAQWSEQHHKETVFCDLSTTTDKLGIAQAVARSLELTMNPKDPIIHLQSEIKRRGLFLLMLDNVEQVIEGAIDLISGWLTAQCEVVILTTSRCKLGVSAEAYHQLYPLSLLEGIELFVQCVQKQVPHFVLKPQNRSLIGNIVLRLDQLPLAIELAAARFPTLSLKEIASRLSECLDLLRSRLRDPEQRALRGALDWSWNLLSDWGQAALTQCSVFRGGFDLEAAEAIIDLTAWESSPSVLDIIEALCDDNLLLKQKSTSLNTRYYMLVSVQAYASEKREEGSTANNQINLQRHSHYYASIFADTQNGERQSNKNLDIELDNFISGTTHGLPEDAHYCCLGAIEILKRKGPMSLAIQLTSEFLQRNDISHDQRLPIQWERVACLRISGKMDQARKEIQSTLALVEKQESQASLQPNTGVLTDAPTSLHHRAEDRKNAVTHADGLLNMGVLEYQRANYEKSLDLTQQAQAIFQQYRSIEGLAKSYRNLGRIYIVLKHPAKAIQVLHKALDASQTADDTNACYKILDSLASLYQQQGDYPQAIEHQQKSLRLIQQLANKREEGRVLGNLGSLQALIGETSKAFQSYSHALSIQRKLSDSRSESLTLGMLGKLFNNQKDYQNAIKHYQLAISITRKTDNLLDEGIFLGNLGNTYLQLRQLKEAQLALQQGIDICRVLNPPICGVLRASLALLHAYRGELPQAFELLHLGEKQASSEPKEHLLFLCKKGEVQLLAGNKQKSRRSLHQAIGLLETIAHPPTSELQQATNKLQELLS